MDKNTIIGLILIFALFMGFSFYTSHKNAKQRDQVEKEMAEKQIKAMQDSISTAMVEQAERQEASGQANGMDSTQVVPKKMPVYATAFQMPADANNGDFQVVTNKAIYSFARKGGYLKRIELKNVYKYAPKGEPKPQVVLYDGEANSINMDLMLKNQATVHTKDLTFSSDVKDTLVVTKDSAVLSLKVFPAATDGDSAVADNQESYIEYRYTFYADDYHFDYKINFVNMSNCLYANNLTYSLDWNAQLTCQERNYQIAHDITTIYYMDNVEDVKNLDERKNDKKDFFILF
ncbi:MAG: YidC/Oxa1 family insertase periplasmic-domain containing protein [Bacteroidales bacterium]|nr:YidC/Oxa1 family insertase periplasmic-domain containing protein [Bacteroidales bacterium]